MSVSEEFTSMAKNFKGQPQHVVKDWLKKVKGFFSGVKSDKKQPNVVKNNRGRPRKTNAPHDNEQRQTSFGIPSSSVQELDTQTTYEVPRHSSYIPRTESGLKSVSDVDSKQPKMYRSQSVTSNRKLKGKLSESMYVPGDEEKVSLQQFSDYIPRIFHRRIKKVVNVLGDGNCGFRAVATALGRDENEWPLIKRIINGAGQKQRKIRAYFLGR